MLIAILAIAFIIGRYLQGCKENYPTRNGYKIVSSHPINPGGWVMYPGRTALPGNPFYGLSSHSDVNGQTIRTNDRKDCIDICGTNTGCKGVTTKWLSPSENAGRGKYVCWLHSTDQPNPTENKLAEFWVRE